MIKPRLSRLNFDLGSGGRANGELAGVSWAAQLGVGAAVFDGLAGHVVDTADRRRAEEMAGALAVAAPEGGAALFFGNTLAFVVRRDIGSAGAEHRDRMGATMFGFPAGQLFVAAGSIVAVIVGAQPGRERAKTNEKDGQNFPAFGPYSHHA